MLLAEGNEEAANALRRSLAAIKRHLNEMYFYREVVDSFGIKKINDYIHVQKMVVDTLSKEGFFADPQGKNNTITNNDSGLNIEITRRGIEETLNERNFKLMPKEIKMIKLLLIRRLPKIIEKAQLLSDNQGNYHKKESGLKYAYLESDVEINGDLHKVTIVVRKSQQKNMFWVHQIDIKRNIGGLPAGVVDNSKTELLTSDVDGSIPRTKEVVKIDFSWNFNETLNKLESLIKEKRQGTLGYGATEAPSLDGAADLAREIVVGGIDRYVAEHDITESERQWAEMAADTESVILERPAEECFETVQGLVQLYRQLGAQKTSLGYSDLPNKAKKYVDRARSIFIRTLHPAQRVV